jgi:hypothetical protein
MEGISKTPLPDRFIKLAINEGYEILTLAKAAESEAADAPFCRVSMERVADRASKTAVHMEEC